MAITLTAESKGFLSALCRYYSEFLETDFHANRPPSRRITRRPTDSLSRIISLSTYPHVEQMALRLLLNRFEGTQFSTVRKGSREFVIRIPKEVVEYIESHYQGPPSLASNSNILEALGQLDFPLKDAILSDFSDILAEQPEIDLIEYAKSYVARDFYKDLFELWKTKEVLDKQDFYLYLFDIRYGDNVYPIFYIPITVSRSDEGDFNLEFDPVILINKKALQYVTEQFAKKEGKAWVFTIPRRHLYLSNYESDRQFMAEIQELLTNLADFFGLQHPDVASTEPFVARSQSATLTNRCYLAVFDKSDEALLTDYEELLQRLESDEDDPAAREFLTLVEDYLFKNPVTYEKEVEKEYDEQSLGSKLAYESPVPLNKEQLEVAKALTKSGCDRIVIQGPPGTGKSHTITAIIFDALLNKKSVLVASDTKEALDVVEDKISKALDRVRLEDFVQNPILRLGKKDNNFHKIFSTLNFDKIKAHFKAFEAITPQINTEITSIISSIGEHLGDQAEQLDQLDGESTKNVLTFESSNSDLAKQISLPEFEALSATRLTDLKSAVDTYRSAYTLLDEDFSVKRSSAETSIHQHVDSLRKLVSDLQSLLARVQGQRSLSLGSSVCEAQIDALSNILSGLEKNRAPIIGFLFKGQYLRAQQSKLEETFPKSAVGRLPQSAPALLEQLRCYQHAFEISRASYDFYVDCSKNLSVDYLKGVIRNCSALIGAAQQVETIFDELTRTCLALGFVRFDSRTLLTNHLASMTSESVEELVKYVDARQQVDEATQPSRTTPFFDARKALEERLICRMSHILDGSVIQFKQERLKDATELQRIIRQKKQIPRSLLKELIAAFPCIIVGIREIGEFIPLEPKIFDVAIIDEASQVSVAQAFPVMIRAKKVVVLGDNKQYSNVKSNNAATAVNNTLFAGVKDAYASSLPSMSVDESQRYKEHVANFNIKTSILEFVRSMANYTCSLKKHFRGYLELIAYSNETFYDKSLQVMKIRGKPISEVIQVEVITSDDSPGGLRNTNKSEAGHIMEVLRKLKAGGFTGTVGIITPFTNQQQLIASLVYDSDDYFYYKNTFDIRVWTFDTAQGQERDLILYSMVERPAEDTLKYIFPVNLKNISDEENGSLKAQRLNVGLSRAKEKVTFIVSKSLDQFNGEIGRALRVFADYSKLPDFYNLAQATDPSSAMELRVLHWLQQTKFYAENRDRLEIIPQFPIGRYIKQLDPLARMPSYRCDFLITYRQTSSEVTSVVLEYDGFEDHFDDEEFVNELNYQRHQRVADIERQKAIEAYGYRFIRLNKFMLREEPVDRIDQELRLAFKKKLTQTIF